MQRHTNTQISSLIVLFSIVTILVQFVTYYFLANFLLIWGVSCLISFLCCHILVEKSSTYESCFVYSILTLFISLIITILTYGIEAQLIVYSNILIGIVAINWIIPMVHCFLRYMVDYGSRIENFSLFYRNTNIVFLIFYFSIFIYTGFIDGAFPWMYQLKPESISFIPFWTLAAYIEDYLYGTITAQAIVLYALTRILLYVPFGFYCCLILRKSWKLIRVLAILLFPIIVELLQYTFIPGRYDTDDIIFGIFGGLIGILCYWIMNLLYRGVSGKDFLSNDRAYGFSSRSLHF